MDNSAKYVYLCSNTPAPYSDNTTSKFRVDLSEPLILDDGEWAVGLREAFFPGDWDNLRGFSFEVAYGDVHHRKDGLRREYLGSNAHILWVADSGPMPESVFLKTKDKTISENDHIGDPVWPPKTYKRVKGKLRDGKYLIHDFKRDFNKKMNHLKQNFVAGVSVNYNDRVDRVEVSLDPRHTIHFQDTLGRKMLGFSSVNEGFLVNSSDKKLKVTLPFKPKFTFTEALAFVYTDIITSLQIGNTTAPILRVVELDADVRKPMEHIHKDFVAPQFRKVQMRRIDSIQIEIRDTLGREFQFNSGEVVIVLEFKKI